MAPFVHLVVFRKQRASGPLECWVSYSVVLLKFVDFSLMNYSQIYRTSDYTVI